MPVSAIVLLAAVLVLDLAWISGVRIAAARAFPGDRAAQSRWSLGSRFLFILLVCLQAALGSSGALARFDAIPPPMFLFVALGFVVTFAVAYTGFGDLLSKHVSYRGLIGFQVFRLLAELTLFFAHREGLAPRQMTFEGYNFDIVTALTAVPIALYAHRRLDAPAHPEAAKARKLVLAWNCMGCAFLAIVLFIAITSFPSPLRLFMGEPSNIWVTRFPYVLLPGVLVVAALTGHLLVFRKLCSRAKAGMGADSPAGH